MTQKPKDKKIVMSKNIATKSNNIKNTSSSDVSKNKVVSKKATILETILDVGKNITASPASVKLKKALSDTAIKAKSATSKNAKIAKENLLVESKVIKSNASKLAKNTKKDLNKKAKIVKASASAAAKEAKKDLDKKTKLVASEIADKIEDNLSDSKIKVSKKAKNKLDKEVKVIKSSTAKAVKNSKKDLEKKAKIIETSAIAKKIKSMKNGVNSKNSKSKKSVNSKLTKTKIVAKEVEDFLKENKPILLEYYDLPYKYNKTVVKVLAQNPNTLFVYWEISDEDHASLEKQYGERFFYITKPVLIVTNLTENYSYEIDIDDFANNWYIHVNDAKCKYKIELGRRPIEITQEVPVAYLPISDSNIIEAPNDHVLFFKEGDKIYFRNLKTNIVTERTFKSSDYSKNLNEIYSNYKLSEEENRFDFKNPSSQNPTSNVM